MIISASRRTDIPAFYSDWLFARIREGHLTARNPRNPSQTRRIELNPRAVDAMVFWTKNPAPMLPKMHTLRDFMYYFQFTLTPYGAEIERNLPDKRGVILPAFAALSREIGAERVIWRYDPIILSEKYNESFHLRAFSELANALKGSTRRVIFSFLDTSYRAVRRNLALIAPGEPEPAQKTALAARLARIARENNMEIYSCASDIPGVSRASCIDRDLIESLLGRQIAARADKNQRPLCGCCESVDIGAYNTCKNGCVYCYANFSAPRQWPRDE